MPWRLFFPFPHSVVFIPGWSFNASIFNSLLPTFENAIAVDLPLISKMNGETFKNVVTTLALSIPKESIIIGWSLGGMVAMQIASLYPQKIKKLILINAAPKWIVAQGWPGLNQKIAAQFLNHAREDFKALLKYFRKLALSPARLRTGHCGYNEAIQKRIHWLAYLELVFALDLRTTYQKLSVPTLHFLGEKDAILPCNAQALADLNAKVELQTIKNTGHAPFLTHPEVFLSRISRFMHSYDSIFFCDRH